MQKWQRKNSSLIIQTLSYCIEEAANNRRKNPDKTEFLWNKISHFQWCDTSRKLIKIEIVYLLFNCFKKIKTTRIHSWEPWKKTSIATKCRIICIIRKIAKVFFKEKIRESLMAHWKGAELFEKRIAQSIWNWNLIATIFYLQQLNTFSLFK